jgi:hypothetical protein
MELAEFSTQPVAGRLGRWKHARAGFGPVAAAPALTTPTPMQHFGTARLYPLRFAHQGPSSVNLINGSYTGSNYTGTTVIGFCDPARNTTVPCCAVDGCSTCSRYMLCDACGDGYSMVKDQCVAAVPNNNNSAVACEAPYVCATRSLECSPFLATTELSARVLRPASDARWTHAAGSAVSRAFEPTRRARRSPTSRLARAPGAASP